MHTLPLRSRSLRDDAPTTPMPRPSLALPPAPSVSRSGLAVERTRHGALRRMSAGNVDIALFVGNELEGAVGNLWLRLRGEGSAPLVAPLLGPQGVARAGRGEWRRLRIDVALRLADGAPAWFWHVRLRNDGEVPCRVELVHAQDLALAPYAALRLNEYYVSQYLDHTPLAHAEHGSVVATRQNQPAAGRHPWCLIGSLRRGVAWATDALQLHGRDARAGVPPRALAEGLPGERLQHEHALVAIDDAPFELAPGASATLGFFGWFEADHPAATSAADLAVVARALALPEAAPPPFDDDDAAPAPPDPPSLFASAPLLPALDVDDAALDAWTGTAERRHVERDAGGRPLAWFHGADRHVVLRAKEHSVLRPHGQLLRSGRHLTPDETALTSTVWMAGVFHSMLTQGHVAINRLLSTVHGYLGLFRSHGLRAYAEIDGAWQLLDAPSAFEMAPDAARWLYRHAGGTLEVTSRAHGDEPAVMSLEFAVHDGAPLRLMLSHHVALDGDDGSAPGAARWSYDGDAVDVRPPRGSALARRFPRGGFRLAPAAPGSVERVGGDELLHADGRSRGEPLIVVVTARLPAFGWRIEGRLVDATDSVDRPAPDALAPTLAPALRIAPPPQDASSLGPLARLADFVPWLAHDAFVHYLSPRGLEQYSGGGWGTRDVCQGPFELLLALGRPEPLRDLLLRVMRAQQRSGDWPQWFTFFERERAIRAPDSHGDIVFWPLLALAQYLLASGDAGLLDERAPYHQARPSARSARPTMWQHAQRALALIAQRVIAGTALPAYGHGDWNDALQPADASMRERMCSAWTATLHHHTLVTLARALRAVGRGGEAVPLQAQADAVRSDFQRLLVVDGVLAGYALFDADGGVRHLLHPRDTATGVRYSALAMIHAIGEDLFTPVQAREHLALIERHLVGPDGLRLFDRPLDYRGGVQRHFQRAETATYFGREIGLMYMHAHLRWAQALAHVGDAEGLLRALQQANPIGIADAVPSAAPRQSNCYHSSSDAAFRDRAQASAEYGRVAAGTVAFEGGWRVYSSGAGIALGLVVRRLLGLDCEADALRLDPVLPPALDGLRVETTLWRQPVVVEYQVRGSGCGVTAVEAGAAPVAFEREANPHRVGAARLPRAELLARLSAGDGMLRVHVGG
jgi:cellobiose phosphorylase